MSDTPSGTGARSSVEPHGRLANFANWLKSVQGIVVTLVAIGAPVASMVMGGCGVALFAHACREVGLVSVEHSASDSIPTSSAEDAAARKQEVQRQIAAAGIQRDPRLEAVNLVVWRQASVDGRIAQLTVAGLGAKGFTVQDRITNLANVAVDDKSPGKIWIKSVAARKDLKEAVRDTILRADPALPAKDVAVSDLDIPSNDPAAVRRAGEIQVDMF
jgi:hypothetical protein